MNLLKCNSWAVSIKDTSLGSKAYKMVDILKKYNYKVVGIGKSNCSIYGIDVYESLKDIPHNIDVVSILESSLETYSILDEMELLDIKNLWFEQESYNELMIQKARNMNLNIVYGLNLCRELSRY